MKTKKNEYGEIIEDESGKSNEEDNELTEVNDELPETDGDDEQNEEDESDDESNEGGEDESDEITITIDGHEDNDEDEEVEKQIKEAPKWVKELRKSHKEAQKQVKELKQQLELKKEFKDEIITLPEKPTLIACDYDDVKFEKELEEWYQKKEKFDKVKSEKDNEKQKQQKEWDEKIKSYNSEKTKIKVKDFAEVEEYVDENFTIPQRAIILQGAEKPALLIYALGKNKKLAKTITEIKDPVKFAFAVAKLEAQMKVTSKKAPAPEKNISGSSKVVSGDATLNKLRAEAEKTGDYDKVAEYRRKQQQKKKG